MRQDYLDELVWQNILEVLKNPTLIQGEIDKRIEETKNSHPVANQKALLEKQKANLTQAIDKLLDAYQEGLVEIAEVRKRMPELQKRINSTTKELEQLKAHEQVIDKQPQSFQCFNHSSLKIKNVIFDFQGRMIRFVIVIERKLHIEVKSLLRQFPAVAILGARQVGKTTMAKEIAAVQKKPPLYLDLENPLDVRRLQDPFTFLTDNKDKCIIIDEVQTIPSLFSVLRSVIDTDRRNGRFILLGSASPQLVKGVSESLAGRIAYRELSPVNILELPEKISMQKHWLRGGFPSALLARSDKAAAEWINSFVRSYIERDLGSLFGVDLSGNTIGRLLSMLAYTNGSVWNAEMMARSLGITAPTVNRYVDFLEGAFLVHRLPAFFINTRKRLVKAPKVYIRDSGLLHQLSNVPNINTLKGHPVVGSSWEGYVAEQINELKPPGTEMYYYRTQAGAEYDIVLARGIKPVACIEVKLNNAPTISKGNYQSIADLETKKNFVVVPDAEEYKTKDGIIICSLKTLLMKYLPKF